MDFYNEVKKVERVKVHSSRETAFLKDMEVFLMVELPSRAPSRSCCSFCCLSLVCHFSEGRG